MAAEVRRHDLFGLVVTPIAAGACRWPDKLGCVLVRVGYFRPE